MPDVLVLAGIDPTGRAGADQDARWLRDGGCDVQVVPTAHTVQRGDEVHFVEATPPKPFQAMLEVAMEQAPAAVKVGLVPDAALARAIGDAVPTDVPLVLDPVLAASARGVELARGNALHGYRVLARRATVVTPNLAEAGALTGLGAADRAAEALVGEGAAIAVVTGAPGDGEAVDVVATREGTRTWAAPWIEGDPRGTGCAFSACLTAAIARGFAPVEAARWAHERVHAARLEATASSRPDRLLPPRAPDLLPLGAEEHGAAVQAAMVDLATAWQRVFAVLRTEHVPEVGLNISLLVGETTVALDGRVVRNAEGPHPHVAGRLHVGGDHHTARIARACHAADPAYHVAMNLRYDSTLLARADALGWTIGRFDRADEPADQARSTMEWGTRHAIETAGGVPALIADAGGPGKEAMVRLPARDLEDLIGRLQALVAGGAQWSGSGS